MPTAAARAPVVVTARALPKGLPMGDVIRIGTETSGDPAYACQHMAAWWPLFKAIVKQDLNLDLEIIQALGGATASAGTHGPPGTALDLRSRKFTTAQTLAVVARARKYGAPATWLRTKAQGFDPHVHLVLDCPCISPADYQITAVKQGYNGLGSGGRGGTDTHPKPDVWRTHAQGIALMQQEDDDMAMTPTERAALIADIAEASRAKIFEQRMTGHEIDPARKPTLHDYLVQTLPARTAAAVHGQWLGSSGPTIGVALQGTYGLVRELADRAGVDLDEAAFAAAVVSEVAPQLIAAIVAKLDCISGVDPAALAAEIVAELGSKLAA